MPQSQIQYPVAKPKTAESERQSEMEDLAATDTTDRDAKLAEIDDLLDEIEDVLIENAETFVNGYVQKGGQ